MPDETVRGADWRKAADLLSDVADGDSVNDMVERTLRGLQDLCAAEWLVLEEFDAHSRPLGFHMYPAPTAFIASLQPAFLAFWSQHPCGGDMVQTMGNGRVSLLSDRISSRAFQKTDLWNEVYIHCRSKNQVLMGGMIEPNRYWGMGAGRLGRDFGQRERELGRFLCPRLDRHFQRQARREKIQRAAGAIARANTPFVIVDPSGQILEVSESAGRLLAATGAPLSRDKPIPGLRPMRDTGAPGRIVRQRLGAIETVGVTSAQQGPAVILLGLPGDEVPPPLGKGLSSRETDVLHWLGEGKSNAEIGYLLGISPRTVGKHCERIFEKLGVENRLAAALTRQLQR